MGVCGTKCFPDADLVEMHSNLDNAFNTLEEFDDGSPVSTERDPEVPH